MSHLTDEQIQEVFDHFDVDGSGKLNMTELGNALNLLCIDLTEEELTDTYRIDDDPETMTLEEFTMLLRDRIGEIDCQERTKQCFKEFTSEAVGNGDTISRDQMKEILTEKGNPGDRLDPDTADALMDDFDLNGDGRFDIEELVKMMYAIENNTDNQEPE